MDTYTTPERNKDVYLVPGSATRSTKDLKQVLRRKEEIGRREKAEHLEEV